MCWLTNNLRLSFPRKSKKNIPILKVTNYDLHGFYYRSYAYELGKLNVLEKGFKVQRELLFYCRVEEGFHSYNLNKIRIKKSCIGNHYMIYKKRNWLANKLTVPKLIGCFPAESTVLVIGYIPKNTRYLENNDGEMVSDKIILTEYLQICVG